jgi:hypothetical protein
MARQQSTQFHRQFMWGKGWFFLSGFALIIGIFIALSPPCRAERHALIIGIGDYEQDRDKLASPPGDARDIASQFRNWKWKIHQDKALVNLNRSELIGAFCDFARKLKKNDDVVIFYTGHGWEVGGELFLYPTDVSNNRNNAEAKLTFPPSSGVNCDVDYGVGPVSLFKLLDLFRVQLNKLIVFYDACRGDEEGVTAEGKFMKQGTSSDAVSAVRGRLPEDLRRVASFSFAISPGRRASPGSDRSPYVDAFLLGARNETKLMNLLKKIGKRSFSMHGQSIDFQGDTDPDYWLGPKPNATIRDRITRPGGNGPTRPEAQSVVQPPPPPPGLQTPP